ncbi:hypothetical protein BABINDRAFT_161802 [Babjeviella inositovora NRRL Y-12698]|uniref:Auxin efflux carrier n=1 Tax=Babjeviella inositovora NRRL Y-12698 TaxID=984486 RepID=A0A1E3QR13_9ASCO|nr:uncharacterized protein BABINDRAFT_161802 [Babjeviella inositovora NRRL Y-12698]ODQ79397.1 hypothetical protein BABINDRAFT_161802 [Babjeviella inositovora NRRL Y-12698]
MSSTEVTLGSVIYTAVKPMFKIYLIMGAGFFLAKKQILTVETSKNISDIVMTLILPCLIFNKVITSITTSSIKIIGIIFLLGTVLFAMGGLLSYAVAKITRSPKRWIGGLLAVGFFPNISDLPIVYVQALNNGVIFSQEEVDRGVAYICIFFAVQIFYQFNLGGYRLVEYDFRDQIKQRDEENKQESSRLISNEKNVNLSPTVSAESEAASHTSSEGYSENFQPPSEVHHDIYVENGYPVPQSIQESLNLGRVTSDHTPYDVQSMAKPLSSKTIKSWLRLRKFAFLRQIFENFLKPTSMSLIISIVISMIPWVRALFIQNSISLVTLPAAPDGNPPLSFIMDFTDYVGACIPFGLIILGATISRLSVRSIPKGFMWTAVSLSLVRLVILPVFGVLISERLYTIGWFSNDSKMLRFISIIAWGLPNSTSLVYVTAFYTCLDSEDHLQMDCLAVMLLVQYPMMAITLPTLVSFIIKHLLKI